MIRFLPIWLAVFAGLGTLLAFSVRTGYEPACQPVSGEHITGRDLGAAVPVLAALPPDLTAGYAPSPGVQRVFQISELQKLATRFGIPATIAAPACFAWPLHSLDRQSILSAVQKALSGLETEVEIADQCRTPVPDGEVVFPLQGLSGESSNATLWNGYISYAPGRRFTTWARVRVTVHENQIVAARALRDGELIGPADVRSVSYSGPLRHTAVVHDASEVAGKCANRPLETGTVLTPSMLSVPEDVARQQLVTVHIYCGAAHIETQGLAVESGHRGDVIKVKNPKTGRVFLARINDPGVVTVVPGGDTGLVVEDKKS